MNRLSQNLTTVYRTERIIARRRLAVVQQQTMLMALAGLAALAGLILLNVALFFVLENWMSPGASAGLLALANLLVAGAFAMCAGRMSAEDEIAPAVEVRDMALASIEEDAELLALEAREMVAVVKGVGANPIGALIPILLPLLTAALKKTRG